MASKKKTPNRSATRRTNAPRPVDLQAIVIRHRAVLDADQILAQARSSRDSLIREALAQGMSVRSVAQALDLSRQSVMQIRDQGVTKPTQHDSDPLF